MKTKGWEEITVSQILSLPKPQFPYLFNGVGHPHLTGLLQRIHEVTYVEHLAH